ncbi:Hypothetical Protein FCC1311_100712 [Hondaea fermentalgiana]|uniref:Uncharacterized protein n=1 Tax=Hondaea fermentalgiana TaxID=2315210 RepID=A0A2R5GVQ2_9STRA|nr:Hypothetical Protein FCC1311_100712 [Hondaea fermentalgiana]|eukprot:GBG33848.1 Hypothetical Protein FCC1311_100712 [Hondaea fermentalgiana]
MFEMQYDMAWMSHEDESKMMCVQDVLEAVCAFVYGPDYDSEALVRAGLYRERDGVMHLLPLDLRFVDCMRAFSVGARLVFREHGFAQLVRPYMQASPDAARAELQFREALFRLQQGHFRASSIIHAGELLALAYLGMTCETDLVSPEEAAGTLCAFAADFKPEALCAETSNHIYNGESDINAAGARTEKFGPLPAHVEWFAVNFSGIHVCMTQDRGHTYPLKSVQSWSSSADGTVLALAMADGRVIHLAGIPDRGAETAATLIGLYVDASNAAWISANGIRRILTTLRGVPLSTVCRTDLRRLSQGWSTCRLSTAFATWKTQIEVREAAHSLQDVLSRALNQVRKQRGMNCWKQFVMVQMMKQGVALEALTRFVSQYALRQAWDRFLCAYASSNASIFTRLVHQAMRRQRLSARFSQWKRFVMFRAAEESYAISTISDIFSRYLAQYTSASLREHFHRWRRWTALVSLQHALASGLRRTTLLRGLSALLKRRGFAAWKRFDMLRTMECTWALDRLAEFYLKHCHNDQVRISMTKYDRCGPAPTAEHGFRENKAPERATITVEEQDGVELEVKQADVSSPSLLVVSASTSATSTAERDKQMWEMRLRLARCQQSISRLEHACRHDLRLAREAMQR